MFVVVRVHQYHNCHVRSCCPIPADATVNFTSSVFPVNEGDGAVQVCVSLHDIPAEGLECEIEVSVGATDGVKAGVYVALLSSALWMHFSA